jgi:hypothetical protein
LAVQTLPLIRGVSHKPLMHRRVLHSPLVTQGEPGRRGTSQIIALVHSLEAHWALAVQDEPLLRGISQTPLTHSCELQSVGVVQGEPTSRGTSQSPWMQTPTAQPELEVEVIEGVLWLDGSQLPFLQLPEAHCDEAEHFEWSGRLLAEDTDGSQRPLTQLFELHCAEAVQLALSGSVGVPGWQVPPPQLPEAHSAPEPQAALFAFGTAQVPARQSPEAH